MTLRDNIDTNKNNRIDVNSQYNEINNFILDKNKGEENLNKLGNHLNNLDAWKLDNLGIKNAIQSYFGTPERSELNKKISGKINKNEPLTNKELSLLYLEMITNKNSKLTEQKLKFDSKQPIEKICGGALISYITNKYGNPIYTGKKVEINLPNQTQKKKPINPLDKIRENNQGKIVLPDFKEIKENEADFYCKKLVSRVEQNFPNEIDKAKRQLQIRHKYKDKSVEQAYIKYETLLIAFNKYCEIVSKNHTKLITSPEIGYKDDEDFKQQMNQIEYFESEISRRYPGIDKILEIVKKFHKEIEKNKKKFFGEDKDGVKLKKAENDYKHFNDFIKSKYKEYDIKKVEQSLKKTPNSGDETVEYFLNYNKITKFQNEINQKRLSYGDSIKKYTSYTENLKSIHDKYNLEQYKDTLSKYNYDVQRLSHGIDFAKFQKYTNKIKYETSLQNGMRNVSLLGNLLMDKTNKYFPFKEIRDAEIQKQVKQNETDKWRNDLKNNSPRIHWLLTGLSGLYNGLVDFTIGTSSSLGVLILGLIGGEDETLAQMDHKEEFDNRFKINISSSQTEEVYNSETGKFNFNLDNTTYTVASSISQMLGLIYGGGAIGKGATKVFQIGENVAGKIGLFSSSFITQVGGSYQEAIKGGLSGGEALGYSMLSATMQSGLELISPNEVLLGKGSGITKELIRNACKSGSKESIRMVGKIFTRNVLNEIREENIQEALQTVAGNLVNMATDGAFGSELGADWSWKNFASTAVITTLTTGITTGTSTGRQMLQLNSSDRTKLIEYIKSDNGTYSDVIEMINDGIAGTIKIPNVDIQQLQELKGLLTTSTGNNTGNLNDDIIADDDVKIVAVDEQSETFGNPEEIRRVANIFNEFVDFNVDEYVDSHANIPLYGRDEQYIRDVLGFLKEYTKNDKNKNDKTKLDPSCFSYFQNARVVDYILSNSKLKIENIKNLLQDEKINIKDIEYAIKQNDNLSENEIKEEIKKFNILLTIESEKDLQKYITGKKIGSDITGDLEQYINENGLSENSEKIENWYYGNFSPETQKFTMARDIGNSEFDIKLIQSIINQQNITPRGLEHNSPYTLLKELHDNNHESFRLYGEYLLGKNVTSLAGEYSVGSFGKDNGDPVLYWHTRVGDGYQRNGSNSKYRIIGEFNPGEIVRSGELNQIADQTANWPESERITLGEVSNNNVSQIIDLETGKIVYDRNSGYVDPSLNNGIESEGKRDYFNGKSHQFEVTESQARGNSEMMDNILSEISEQNESEKLEELRKIITEQYEESTGEKLELSDEQILSILDAHEQDGKLGELTLGQLKVKVKILSKAITDSKVRRFLLEAGFCGKIEIISDIQNNIPSLLNKYKKSSINFEFSKNNPELHESFIKTGIIAKLTNYTDITIEKGGNPELLEILKQAQEELENLPYEERLKIITNINSYLESAKKANSFINLVKRGGTTAKELFLRAKGENTNRIADFEGEITVKQYRNSIVFEFEKSSDVIRFFKNNGNGLHFASNIAGLDTIMINKENCKKAENLGMNRENAENRTILHESQHTINKFFMTKTKDITHQEAKDPEKTDIESFKQYALDRAKDEIIAQYTNRLIIKNLSKETISILSKGGGIKELLTKEGNVYDYFKERRTTPEGKKAREEHIEKVKNLIDCIDETFKTLLNSGFYSDTNIQNVLNLFSCTNITERKNIQNMVNNKFNINEYFDGKSHKFEVTESQARGNSENMDNLINEINDKNQKEKLQELKNNIEQQYKQATGEELQLSDEQLLSIIDAHEQDGILGELTLGELKVKVKILSEAITDPKVRRFLLEAGFCGQERVDTKTNVERLKELGIKIPEDSKESVNKMELNFEIIGNQNINNISPSDFEKLIDSHIEFPKSLITPELINKLLDTKNVGESRILIEKFSKNNDADLFNSMLKKREEKIIENINSRNGFISKYEQLATDLENFEYNENNIDEFRKILERHHNEIPAGFINYLLEIFPSKSDINETITYLNSTELSDIIIDYHFNDISYNIFLDIKELLNFQVSNGITIPIEHLKMYKNILDIDTLPTKEKIKLHNELKNKNVIEMFYNDYSSCRDRMYQEIADSILNKEKLEQFKDNKLSEQHGISIYKFDGQEFFALERESGVGLGVGLGNTGITKGFSFSLVGKDCIGTRYSKNFGKPVNSFIYEGLNPQAIMHVFPKDSHTNSQYQPRRNDSNRHNFGQIVNTLMSPTELLKATQEYNEIFVLRNGNNGNQYQSIGEIKPIALYCYDEITPEDIETAKRENVGIMLIKTDAYKKNAVVSEWGENFNYNDHTYIDGKDRLDNAIYSRADITTFKKNEEFNDILNNVDNKSDYFDGKSHKIFKGDTTKAKLNSKTSDRILSEINEKNKYTKLEELRKEITEQYKQATGEELRLTNEQLLSILNAHKQDGKLGELTLGQLKVKVKILSEAITDQKVRRFLLEAGFCGNKSGTEVLGNTEKTEFIQDFFNIDKIKSIEELKEKGDYLYFNGKNKRKEFKDAIFDGDFELAKKLYTEALNVTKDKLKKVGLTPEQNKFIVDCFRRRDYNGIKKILEETKKTTKENTQVEDTEKKYSKIVEDKETGEKRREYDNIEKAMYKDPITEKEVLMTRRELHERIIEKFLLDGEASKGEKQLIMSGGLPGAGKSTIEKSLKDIPKVIVNPDLVKDYLPEYYDELGRKFGAGTVHEESSYISKIIYDRAIKGGYSILYDSSMKDKPYANPPFPKYDKIVESAYNQGYKIQARFIYDGGESRYRNAVIRERSMGLDNYNAYGTAYKTIEYLSKDKRVDKTIIYDNSGNGKSSSAKIIYENQQINMAESDQELINKFNDYQTFLDNLL